MTAGQDIMMYRDVLRFAHFSVREYLLSTRISKGMSPGFQIFESVAHQLVTKICLVYLLSFDGPTSLQKVELLENFPLLDYAALFWHEHYQVRSLDASELSKNSLACRLFDWRSNSFMNWLNIALFPRPSDDVEDKHWFRPTREVLRFPRGYYNPLVPDSRRSLLPLYFSSLLGLCDVAERL